MMLGECETALSAREMELEALRSIYVNELEVDYDDSVPSSVAIWLHPATADNLEEQYVRIFLIFKLPEKYPESVPDISIRNPRGLSDEQINRIVQKLLSIAETMKGSSMLFALIEAAKEQLTAENRPSEDCAICLYGFLEGDVFTKTDCYHYFHSHCLSRYLKSKLDEDDTESEQSDPQKPLCPVCRVPITFNPKSKDFPEPVAVASAYVSVTESSEYRKEMEQLYQKQLAQGGIIDVEAEKNKFLLEIANVSSERIPENQETADAVTDNNAKESESYKLENVSSVRNKKVAQTYSANPSNNSVKSNSHDGYKQLYKKNHDRSNEVKVQKKMGPNGRYQTHRSLQSASPDMQQNNERENEVLSNDDDSKEPETCEDYSSSNQSPPHRNTYSNYQNFSHYGQRNNKSKTNSQHNGPRNYYNAPSYRSYKNYNDGHWKSRGGSGQKKYGGSQMNNSPSHGEHSVECSLNEGLPEKECTKNMSANDHYHEENKPIAGKSHYKRYEWNDKRYNSKNQSKFPDEQSHYSRYSKNRENHQSKQASPSTLIENNESDGTASNVDRNFNSRPYRYRNHDHHRRYNAQLRSYHENNDKYENVNMYRDDQSHLTNTNSHQQSHSSRYQGNSFSSNRKYNHHTRNSNSNCKNAFKDTSRKESKHEDDVPNHSPKLHADNDSENFVSASTNTKGQVNYVQLSDDCVKPIEKCVTSLRPPPGFANPLKRVVYGLPSVNPPPGFGQS